MLKKMRSMVTLGDPQVQVKRELTAKDIERGFKKLSSYIREANPSRVTNPLRIIVSGGAVSVFYLGNRTSTKDIDFMSSGADEFSEVFAAKYGARKDLETYHGDWINANMVAHVNGEADCTRLFENSVNLGEILYKSDVLVVYVADWCFQLVGKIQECCSSGQSNDPATLLHLSDAIHILRLRVTRNGGALPIAAVRSWYAAGPLLGMGDLAYVDEHYQRQFGVRSGFAT